VGEIVVDENFVDVARCFGEQSEELLLMEVAA
jgi:hypothetical protein